MFLHASAAQKCCLRYTFELLHVSAAQKCCLRCTFELQYASAAQKCCLRCTFELQVDQKCSTSWSFECRWLKSTARAVLLSAGGCAFECRGLKSAAGAVLLSAGGSEVLNTRVFAGFSPSSIAESALRLKMLRKPNLKILLPTL